MRFYSLLLASCLALPLATTATAQQDLNRVNDIVNQARSLADSLTRPVVQSPALPTPQNPFAARSDIGKTQNLDKPRVGISDSNIQIDVNGRSLNIPRINASSLIYREDAGWNRPSPPMNIGNPYRKSVIPAQAAGYVKMAEAISNFKAGNFELALQTMNQAIQTSPEDTRLHPFYAQVLFANRKYDRAAEFAAPTIAIFIPGFLLIHGDVFSCFTIKAANSLRRHLGNAILQPQ